MHAAELARVDALSAARVAWTADMGAAQVTAAADFGTADKGLTDAQHDADVQFAQSQAGAIAGQERAAASLSKTLSDSSAAADRVWAKDVALADKDYSQLLAGDDAALALHQAQNQDAYDLAADTSYKAALVSWSAGLSGQNALLAGYLVHVAGDAVARDNELAPAWEQLTQASSAADVARANSAAAADKTLADSQADASFTYATASDTATSTQAGELADADRLQSVAIATAAANRTRAGAYAEAAYNVKVAQAEAAYANTAAADGALWESIAKDKHRASQWTSADDLLFARANEARDNGDNAAEVIRVQALGLAAIERTQSLGDADVAQVTAIQDAKLASTRSAAAAANHLAASQKDASHDLTNSETAAQTTHDHTLAVADKTWTHDGDAANATYASASADADTHYGDAQAADEASFQVASANAAANLITDQTSFSAVYAHAKAAWFLGLSTPPTSGGLSPYVAYAHAMSLADKADSLAVSAAEAAYDDTVSNDAVTLSDSTSGAAALRQTNDAAAEDAFGVTETSLQGVREIAVVQADRTLAIQVTGAKRDFTVASAKADITQAVADSRAEADRKNALDAAATAYDRAVLETPGDYVNYSQALASALSAAATQFFATQAVDRTTHDVSVGDAGLGFVNKQADANVIDTTQVAQADADLQQGEAPAQKDLNIALADDAKAEASSDAAAQLLRDQLNAAAAKLASTIETAATGVQSHFLAVATTGLWTAKAAQQVSVDSSVAASADAATASYAPVAHYLSDRATAMASWTTDLVSHYIAYTDSQSALDSTESSADSTAQETDSNTWSAQESSADQQGSVALNIRDRAIAVADSAFVQGIAPLAVAYQTALANAQRAFMVGQASAQRALDLGGTLGTFNATVQSLKGTRLAAQQAAATDFSSAEFVVEKADRTASIDASQQLSIEADRIVATRHTAELEADKLKSAANTHNSKTRLVDQALLDLGYTLWKAGGLESTLTALATAHPCAWATEQNSIAQAAQARTAATASALFTMDTALANADEVQQLAAIDADTTRKEAMLEAMRTTNDSQAHIAHDRAFSQLSADDASNQSNSYNALLPQASSTFSVVLAKDLIVQNVTITNQTGADGYLSSLNSQMYARNGNNLGFFLGTINSPQLQEHEDLQARVAGDLAAAAVQIGNLHAVCFAAGTTVLTDAGWVAIEHMVPGAKVLAANEHDPEGPLTWKTVEQIYHNAPQPLLNLHFGGFVVRTTSNHPFYVRHKGWQPAGLLAIGDQFRNGAGTWETLTDKFDNGDIEPVYNLRVADHHTYFVGNGDSQSVLVHTDALNELRSYNAQTQQQKSSFLLSTPEKPFSLTTPKDLAAKVTIAAQPAPDGFFVASDGKMYRSSSGSFIFQLGKIGKELQEGEQDLAANTAEVTKTPSIPDSTGPNGGSFVLQLDNTVSLDDFVDPTARGFFVAYCKDLNLDPATARVDYSQLHQAWKEVHAFADRQNKQFEQQAIAAVREAIRGWRQDQATAESAGRPGFFASVSNFVEEVFATMAAVRKAQQNDQHSTEWHIANTPNDYIPGSEAIKWKYLKPAVDDAYRAAHPTLAAWGGEPHQPTAEEKARMSLLVAVAGDTAAGIWVPGYGEYQDVQVLSDPDAPTWQKGLSAVTLAGGFITAGFLPNFGTFFRPVKKAVNGADEIADATQAAARIETATVHAAEDAAEQIARTVTPPHGALDGPSVGETASTATGKNVHKAIADARRASGEFDLVQSPITDKSGNPILVSKRVDLKTGKPQEGSPIQSVIPDAVSFKRQLILDDKPLGRSIAKDRQEIIRFIKAYEQREGHLPDVIAITRYNPSTGREVLTELYSPQDFLP